MMFLASEPGRPQKAQHPCLVIVEGAFYIKIRKNIISRIL